MFPKNKKKIEGNQNGCSADFGDHSKNIVVGDYISVSYGRGLLKVIDIESIEDAIKNFTTTPSGDSGPQKAADDFRSKSDFIMTPNDKLGKKERRFSQHNIGQSANHLVPVPEAKEETSLKKKVRFTLNLACDSPRKDSFDCIQIHQLNGQNGTFMSQPYIDLGPQKPLY